MKINLLYNKGSLEFEREVWRLEGYRHFGNHQFSKALVEFVEGEVLPGLDVESGPFWRQVSDLMSELAPANRLLLVERDGMQEQLDHWYREFKTDGEIEEVFLREIGYLEEEVGPFHIETEAVDLEIKEQAGPQLVVPLDNARYALNAANARWGSLYDALYGTDVIPGESPQADGYDPVRGAQVIAYAKQFLDYAIPLAEGSHTGATGYKVEEGHLLVELADKTTVLKQPEQWVGRRDGALLFRHNGLHIELQFDPQHPVGMTDPSSLKDIVIEAATTTIVDCEDSVAAVDAPDKIGVYRNWLGLMNGTLEATFEKNGQMLKRRLNRERQYEAPDGSPFELPGRSLLFIRNVGHLMTTELIKDESGMEMPEGIVDTVLTSLIAKHDLMRSENRNSRTGSIYIVKPKMHGSAEVAFTNELFDRVEDLINVPRHTIKVGVMDEERRTSLNLRNCIHAVRKRIVFINTGFLDRTGDEIHSVMEAGPVVRKQEMKRTEWLNTYEDSNVATGLLSGFAGRAQVGKGMWAMPDLMLEMMQQKVAHVESGASTAWVPSPTAATLHALHYHMVDVKTVQRKKRQPVDRLRMLTLPLMESYSEDEIREELENNCQSILGYVVRWVEQGVGCSKVPDIHGTGLMEDRATLRISSQHIANWLKHGVVTEEQVRSAMERMRAIVDEQNEKDPNYRPMAGRDSVAFEAALELVFEGHRQPNGYTEPILHRRRKEFKRQAKQAPVN